MHSGRCTGKLGVYFLRVNDLLVFDLDVSQHRVHRERGDVGHFRVHSKVSYLFFVLRKSDGYVAQLVVHLPGLKIVAHDRMTVLGED